MGIFDIFKSKKNELSLEQLLQKAAEEPSYRAAFYKRILDEELVVLSEKSSLGNGTHTLKEDTNVRLISFGEGVIPVFTSTDRIFDENIIKEQVNYLQMKGVTLLEMTKGATLILNPYSKYSKELPLEIEKILNGTIITENHQQLILKNNTKIQLGQPDVYPTDIINSLKVLFAKRPNINKAYLGWLFNPESGEPPHYIFGLDVSSNIEDLINEAGFTIKEFLSSSEFVDFIKIEKKDGLSAYFINNTKPFYEKNR